MGNNELSYSGLILRPYSLLFKVAICNTMSTSHGLRNILITIPNTHTHTHTHTHMHPNRCSSTSQLTHMEGIQVGKVRVHQLTGRLGSQCLLQAISTLLQWHVWLCESQLHPFTTQITLVTPCACTRGKVIGLSVCYLSTHKNCQIWRIRHQSCL